ncbi:MAG: PASTA domain-containing protein [Clostridiales bacterium]|nr:PASTA domain-containing protein [Clostridiales bacterium]
MNTPTLLIKRKLIFVMVCFVSVILLLCVRIFFIQAFEADKWQALAYEQQTRDRLIKPKRGIIYDRNMEPIAINETVASVSVINSQIKDKQKVASVLSEMLDLDYNAVMTKVNKRVALERIKTKVPKELADEIRKLEIPGIIVDEDIKRVYPFSSMGSQVLGFVGKDNQGIIGLEAKYNDYLMGKSGKILTEADAGGIELKNGIEERIAPEDGNNLVTTIDVVIQQYAEQILAATLEAKSAKRGAIIMMDIQNGEILAMANKPDFDLNDPFTINNESLAAIWDSLPDKDKNNYLNQMWRNFSINDTYEPGSTFKIITSAAGLQEGKVTGESTYNCSGSVTVGGRQIKCWRHPRSHGQQNFIEGVQNSCNPVFMKIGEELGAEVFYEYMMKFGFKDKTGIDLPGEAVGIMHKLENIGSVELATMSFGQSFQITPLQLLRAASAAVNGGYLVTPHFGKQILSADGEITGNLEYPISDKMLSDNVSETMKTALEAVVSAGSGNKTYVPGYRIGGKTATSEKLPRRTGKYISSILTIAPVDDPKVISLVLIDEPQGIYYGGQVAGPVMKSLLENALPYLNISPRFTEEELKLPEAIEVKIPGLVKLNVSEAKEVLKGLKLEIEVQGEGDIIIKQFPLENEIVNLGSRVTVYTGDKTQDGL